MTIERYNYNDEPSGRSETLVNVLDELERTKKQLAIAVEAIKAVLHDEFILEHADAGLVMYLTQAEYKIKELEK